MSKLNGNDELKRGNLLWESSRMMLPEHKEALQNYRKECVKKTKPTLDKQQLDEISSAIQVSYQSNAPITLTVFEEYEDRYKFGIVTNVDPQLKKIKFNHDGEFEWVDCALIINALYDA